MTWHNDILIFYLHAVLMLVLEKYNAMIQGLQGCSAVVVFILFDRSIIGWPSLCHIPTGK